MKTDGAYTGLGTGRWAAAICMAAIAVLAAGLYAQTLSYGFVYDDKVQVLENHWLEDPAYLPDIFSSGVWGFRHMATNYYRPLMHVTYMAAYHLFGPSPPGFHLVNIALNAGVCVLVFLLIRSLLDVLRPGTKGAGIFPAFLAAAIFAAHPVHTEAVAWVAGLPDIGFAFFALLSFYLYVRPDVPGLGTKGSCAAASAACYFLAALFKEPALGLPVLFAAYDVARPRGLGGRAGPVRRYAPYAAAAAVYLLARIHALGGFAPNPGRQDMSAYGLLVNAFVLFGGYVSKLFWPADLSAYHEFSPATSFFDPAALPYVLAAGAFLAAAAIAIRKDRPLFVGLAMVLVPLLPALYIPGVGENAFAERYLYMPSAGLAFVAALMVHRAKGRAARTLAVAAAAAVVVVFGAMTLERSAVWKDDLSLWSDAAAKSPGSAAANDALGLALDNTGRRKEAMARFESAVASGRVEAYVHLGNMYNRSGDTDEAVRLYEDALLLAPGNAYAHNNLGVALAKKGLLEEAVAEFRAAIGSKTYYLDAHINLVRAYARLGMRDKAEKCMEEAVRLFPHRRDELMRAAEVAQLAD